MKIKTLITIVVGKGNEVAPNEVIDLPELEAKRLIAGGFAEEVLKAPATRQKPTTPPQIKPQIQPQVSQNPDPQSSLANNDNDGLDDDSEEDEIGDEDDDTPPDQGDQQPV